MPADVLRQSSDAVGHIRELRAQGLSLRQIAAETGASYQAVRKAVDPAEHKARLQFDNAKRKAAKRAWENEHDRSECPTCGGPMAVGAARRGFHGCMTCRRERSQRRMVEAVRLRNVESLDTRDIAVALGITVSAAATLLSRARAAGFEVARAPYMTNRREALRAT